jgi:hypothetical protein
MVDTVEGSNGLRSITKGEWLIGRFHLRLRVLAAPVVLLSLW